MRVEDEMIEKLKAAFSVVSLDVKDVSEAHRGHAGFREGGQTHFDVVLKAPEFKGQSRIARHRSVHAALGPELIARIHALSLDLSD